MVNLHTNRFLESIVFEVLIWSFYIVSFRLVPKIESEARLLRGDINAWPEN
jgi:hypothetical protein